MCDCRRVFGLLDLLAAYRSYYKHHYRYFHNLQFTATHTIVLSLLHSPLSVSWQRILTQELQQSHWITHSKYHSTTAHVKSSLHSSTAELMTPSVQLSSNCSLQLQLRNSTANCQSQSQSYVTTDDQSASLSWNKAPIWGLRPDVITVWQLRACWCGALSLTRGRVCRLSESQSAVISLLSVCTIYILHVIKCMYIQHIQGLCQSRLSTADRALLLVTPATTAV
jgi:hypothetical protein